MRVEAIDGDTIYITYDLLQTTEARIEGEIVNRGVSLGNYLAEQLRHAVVNFMEETPLDTLKSDPIITIIEY